MEKLLNKGRGGKSKMKTITNLRYVTVDDVEAPVDRSDPDSPYHGPGQTALSIRVVNSIIDRIRWDANRKKHEVQFKNGIFAVLDPISDLIVAIASYKDLPWPNNAIVLNPDGTLNHQIISPQFVIKTMEEMPGEKPILKEYPVECIDEVLWNGRILIGLNFNYEWIERRYYDPTAQQWQERDQIYRK